MSQIEKAVAAVVDAKDTAAEFLSPAEYRQFLDELLAVAAGWKMELEEM